jgi:hypothetical protein
MSKFGLKENTITVRDQSVKCRELTYAERAAIIGRMNDDKQQTHAMFAAAGCIEPGLTEEEAAGESADVVTQIGREVMRLSGLSVGDEDSSAKKD